MALVKCYKKTDNYGKEMAEHGNLWFPAACYYDNMEENELPWHWHEEFEFELLVEGEAIFAVGEEYHEIHAGEGVFINSSRIHGCWKKEGGECKFRTVVFHPNLIADSPDSVFYQKYLRNIINNFEFNGVLISKGMPEYTELLTYAEKAWNVGVNEPFGYEFEMRNLLSKIICILYKEIECDVPKYDEKKHRDNERIKIMLKYIHDNMHEQITVKDIARSAAISESECLRCFHATIKTTPIQYMRRYRISQSAKLLLTTDDKISSIAKACGFDDMSYFAKTFKEIKSVTPNKYRSGRNARNK